MASKVVVNINGDLASTVLVYQLLEEGKDVSAITFKRQTVEEEKTAVIAALIEKFDLQVHEINVSEVDYLFDDPLTAFLYMLSFQVTLAKSLSADIYSASYKGDEYNTLPAAISKSIFLGTNKTIRLNCPYLRMSEDKIQELALKFGIEIEGVTLDKSAVYESTITQNTGKVETKAIKKSVKLNPTLEEVASDAATSDVRPVATVDPAPSTISVPEPTPPTAAIPAVPTEDENTEITEAHVNPTEV